MMASVYCAAIDCKHNNKNKCSLKKIRLNEGHVHTRCQGFKQIWECLEYEQSEESKKMDAIVRWLMHKDGDGNG